MRSSSSCRC